MFKLLLLGASVLVLGDGQKLETDISLNNPTRIIFEDDRPTKFIYNESETNAPEIAAELGAKGDIFISVEKGLSGQSVSGFMATESGKTYPVKFKIKSMDMSQLTIVSSELREEAKRNKWREGSSTPTKKVEWTRKSSYSASLGMLVRTLYYNAEPEGFETGKLNGADKITGKEYTAVPVKRYVASNIEATTYLVRANTGNVAYLPSIIDQIPSYLAISYSTETLSGEEKGFLYVVKKRGVGEHK